MSKAKGPDTNKWKKFRYNLVKEDVDTNSPNDKYFDYQWGEGISFGSSDKIYYDKKSKTIQYTVGNTKGVLRTKELEGLRHLLDKYSSIVDENIEIDADNEADVQNWMDEPEGPFSYQLKNGKTLEIDEKDGPGMAGEPMTFTLLKIDGKTVRFDNIKHLMKPQDAQELKKYLDETEKENEISADSFVREGKASKYFDVAKWRETHKK